MVWTSMADRFPLVRQLTSYGLVGGIAAVTDYALMIGLREGLGIATVPSALAGYTLGSIVSYTLNRAFTFESTRSHRSATIRFAAICVLGFTLTGLLMELLANRLQFPYVFARVQTTALVFLFNFSCHRLWTFRNRRAGHGLP